MREWIRYALYFADYYEPQLSAVRELEQSGKMELLQDADLGRELAALSQKLGHFEIFLSSDIRTQENLIDPYLASHFDRVSILSGSEVSLADVNAPLDFDSSIFGEIGMRSRIALKLSLRRAMHRPRPTIEQRNVVAPGAKALPRMKRAQA